MNVWCRLLSCATQYDPINHMLFCPRCKTFRKPWWPPKLSTPFDTIVGFFLALLLVFGIGCGHTKTGERIQRWYERQMDLDEACLGWCQIEMGVHKSLLVATPMPYGSKPPCKCQIMMRLSL